jgi:hypothetical protein
MDKTKGKKLRGWLSDFHQCCEMGTEFVKKMLSIDSDPFVKTARPLKVSIAELCQCC